MPRTGNKKKAIAKCFKKKKKSTVVTEIVVPTGSYINFQEQSSTLQDMTLLKATKLECTELKKIFEDKIKTDRNLPEVVFENLVESWKMYKSLSKVKDDEIEALMCYWEEIRIQLYLKLYINKFKEVKLTPESVKYIIISVLARYPEFNTKSLYELIDRKDSILQSINTTADLICYLADVIEECKFFDTHREDFIRMHPEFTKVKLEIFKKAFHEFSKSHKELSKNENMIAFKQYPYFNAIYELIYSHRTNKNEEALNNIICIVSDYNSVHNLEHQYKALVNFLTHTKISLSEENLSAVLFVAETVADYNYINLIKQEKLILIDKYEIQCFDNIKTEWQKNMGLGDTIIKNFELGYSPEYLKQLIGVYYHSYNCLVNKTNLSYAKLFLNNKHLSQSDNQMIYNFANECKNKLLILYQLFDSHSQHCPCNFENTEPNSVIQGDLSISNSSIDSLTEYAVF